MTRHVHLHPPWLPHGVAHRMRSADATVAGPRRTGGARMACRWGGVHRGGGRTSPRRMDVAGVSCLLVRRHRERGSEGRIKSLMSNNRPKGVDVDGERMW